MRLILFIFLVIFGLNTKAQLRDSVKINPFTLKTLSPDELGWLQPKEDHEVFLIGEYHNVSVNPKLLGKLFMHLHKEANARYIIIEYGSAEAYLYNQYLESGDTTFLFHTWNFQFSEYRELWKRLYEFNLTLGVEDKVEVIGIDFEWEESLLEMIKLLSTNVNPPESVKQFIKKVEIRSKKSKRINSKKWILEQRSFINKHNDDFKKYYSKQDYTQLILAINNNAFYKNMAKRDKEMYHNFHRVYPSFKRGGFVGILGNKHTDKQLRNSFAHKLNNKEHSKAKGKVMTLFTYYYRCCTSYDHQNDLFEIKLGNFFNAKEEERFKQFVYELEEKYYLLDLRNRVAEFTEIVKHYDLMFIIKEQKAATHIKVE